MKYILISASVLVCGVCGFNAPNIDQRRNLTFLNAQNTRTSKVTQSAALLLLPFVIASSHPIAVHAEEDSASSTAAAAIVRSIPACLPEDGACLSTSSTRDISKFSPPWSYDVARSSPESTVVALKKSLQKVGSITEEDGSYISASFSGFDLSCVVRSDGAVTYKIAQSGGGFKLPGGEKFARAKLEEVRSGSGVFGETDLSYDTGYKGGEKSKRDEGAFGQLKAFYGLQSGNGSEDIFEE
uniref:Uncharacterized protein n=1 Tax=Corethron hystrix TaxID=216773 RepID=A0A7S1BI80_9STRA|mmetsp:Transcript_27067/g.62248  ORF Transcript_27067/g.62248 Transcript_27067/m.62248 type:complete len:241 (+) Transcript_27067:210-932(+)